MLASIEYFASWFVLNTVYAISMRSVHISMLMRAGQMLIVYLVLTVTQRIRLFRSHASPDPSDELGDSQIAPTPSAPVKSTLLWILSVLFCFGIIFEDNIAVNNTGFRAIEPVVVFFLEPMLMSFMHASQSHDTSRKSIFVPSTRIIIAALASFVIGSFVVSDMTALPFPLAPVDFFALMTGIVLLSSKLIVAQYLLTKSELGPIALLRSVALPSAIFFTCLALVTGDIILLSGAEFSPSDSSFSNILLIFCTSSAVSLALCIASFMTSKNTLPLTMSLGQSAIQLVVIATSSSTCSPQFIVGALLVLLGIALYCIARYKEQNAGQAWQHTNAHASNNPSIWMLLVVSCLVAFVLWALHIRIGRSSISVLASKGSAKIAGAAYDEGPLRNEEIWIIVSGALYSVDNVNRFKSISNTWGGSLNTTFIYNRDGPNVEDNEQRLMADQWTSLGLADERVFPKPEKVHSIVHSTPSGTVRVAPHVVLYDSSHLPDQKDDEAKKPLYRYKSIVGLDGLPAKQYPPYLLKYNLFKWVATHLPSHVKWVVRVDDDVYLCPNRLRQILSKLNHHGLVYAGRQRTHIINEYAAKPLFEELVGAPTFEFVAGPAVAYSVPLLRRLAPNIDSCIANHERVGMYNHDPSMGFCVYNKTGVLPTHLGHPLLSEQGKGEGLFAHLEDIHWEQLDEDALNVLKYGATFHKVTEITLQKVHQKMREEPTC